MPRLETSLPHAIWRTAHVSEDFDSERPGGITCYGANGRKFVVETRHAASKNVTLSYPKDLVCISATYAPRRADTRCNSIRGKKDRSSGSRQTSDAPHKPGPSPRSPDHHCGARDGNWRTCGSAQACSGSWHRPARRPLACAD